MKRPLSIPTEHSRTESHPMTLPSPMTLLKNTVRKKILHYRQVCADLPWSDSLFDLTTLEKRWRHLSQWLWQVSSPFLSQPLTQTFLQCTHCDYNSVTVSSCVKSTNAFSYQRCLPLPYFLLHPHLSTQCSRVGSVITVSATLMLTERVTCAGSKKDFSIEDIRQITEELKETTNVDFMVDVPLHPIAFWDINIWLTDRPPSKFSPREWLFVTVWFWRIVR